MAFIIFICNSHDYLSNCIWRQWSQPNNSDINSDESYKKENNSKITNNAPHKQHNTVVFRANKLRRLSLLQFKCKFKASRRCNQQRFTCAVCCAVRCVFDTYCFFNFQLSSSSIRMCVGVCMRHKHRGNTDDNFFSSFELYCSCLHVYISRFFFCSPWKTCVLSNAYLFSGFT